MNYEYSVLVKNNTWKLVLPPSDKNVIGCKWVFKVKRHSDGSTSRYKARVVANGFHQKPGFDYQETSSPVAKPTTIRTLLSLPVMNNWPLQQVDVNNAFLNGILEEEVYMSQPPGFIAPGTDHMVCKLVKSLCGLKQALRAWFEKFKSVLVALGFRGSRADNSLFIKNSGGFCLYVLVYVDDLVITVSSVEMVE